MFPRPSTTMVLPTSTLLGFAPANKSDVLQEIEQKLGVETIISELEVVERLTEDVRERALAHSDLLVEQAETEESEEDKDARTSSILEEINQLLADTFTGIVGAINNHIIDDVVDITQTYDIDMADAKLRDVHAKYTCAIDKYNALLAETKKSSQPTKCEKASLFEQERYEACLTSLNELLGEVGVTKSRIDLFKQLERKLTSDITAMDHTFANVTTMELDTTDIRALMASLNGHERQELKTHLEDCQSEIKTMRRVLAGQVESVATLMTEYYPTSDSDWTGIMATNNQSSSVMRVKEYKIDKSIDLVGDPDAAVAEKWASYNSMFMLLNHLDLYALLLATVRTANDKTSTNQHWQPPSISEWLKDPSEVGSGFHVAKLIHLKEPYISQCQNMFIKTMATHPEIVQKATSGTIYTQVGGRDIESNVMNNDFVMLISYYI